MTTELDKARRALQASFNLGIARGVEFVTNIEALVRAILADQDGSKDQAVADAIVKVAEIVARAVSEGKAPNSNQDDGWHDCGATEALRAAHAAKDESSGHSGHIQVRAVLRHQGER
jgi:hypothetical protein